jgi:leucyl-tRNA---protein transferase
MQRAVHRVNSLMLSPEHACNYLPDKMARMIFLGPDANSQIRVYSRLAEHGFRRSGPYLYRPNCERCQACIPVRVPVENFITSRSQRRTWRRNQDLSAQLLAAEFVEEHFDLYQRYMAWRHPHNFMETTAADYAAFLTGNENTFFLELRLRSQLVGIAVVDELEDALSAVYTFYKPEMPQRSLGTYAILWQIAEARRRYLRWLYLGYWIAASPKMAYKSRFQPLEQLTDNGWELHV